MSDLIKRIHEELESEDDQWNQPTWVTLERLIAVEGEYSIYKLGRPLSVMTHEDNDVQVDRIAFKNPHIDNLIRNKRSILTKVKQSNWDGYETKSGLFVAVFELAK